MNKHFKTSLTEKDLEGAGRVVAWITRKAQDEAKDKVGALQETLKDFGMELDSVRMDRAGFQRKAIQTQDLLDNSRGHVRSLQREIAALRKDGQLAFKALALHGDPRETGKPDALYRRALRAGKLFRTTRGHLRKSRIKVKALEQELTRSRMVTRETQRQYNELDRMKRGFINPKAHNLKVNQLTGKITELQTHIAQLNRSHLIPRSEAPNAIAVREQIRLLVERDAWRLRALETQLERVRARGEKDLRLEGEVANASFTAGRSPLTREIFAKVDDELTGILHHTPGKMSYACRAGAVVDGVSIL